MRNRPENLIHPNVKSYYLSNAAHPLSFGGREITFEPVSVQAGRVGGVYTAQSADEELLLDAACGARVGVSPLSDEDVNKLLKKNPATQPSFGSSNSSPRLIQAVPDLPVVPNDVPSVGSAAASDSLPTVKSLIEVGKVASPQPLINPDDRLSTNWTAPKSNITIRHIGAKSRGS